MVPGTKKEKGDAIFGLYFLDFFSHICNKKKEPPCDFFAILVTLELLAEEIYIHPPQYHKDEEPSEQQPDRNFEKYVSL